MIAEGLVTLAVGIDGLQLLPGNPRQGDVPAVARSLAQFGQRKPVVALRDGTVIAGNHTLMAARSLGWETLAVVYVDDDDTTAKAYALADNRTAELGGYDDGLLAELIAQVQLLGDDDLLAATGWDQAAYEKLVDGLAETAPLPPSVALADRFLVPPFSILDARQGYWQARKDSWDSIGLRGGAGRALGLVYGPTTSDPVSTQIRGTGRASYGDPVTEQIADMTGGTSLFDPVLCEVLLSWFSRPGARVLDPFAGGSVRGIVSALLGREYVGVDLSPTQVAANVEQATQLCAGDTLLGGPCPMPQWVQGDARDITALWPDGGPVDMLLTCPPYFDLEVYGDDPADLSRCADIAGFTDALATALTGATARLQPNRFACVVMGEARDKKGNLEGLVPATIDAARRAGLAYYNEAILVTPVGTNAVRAPRPFLASRKIVRGHQTVLVFVKGDASAAATWLGDVELGTFD